MKKIISVLMAALMLLGLFSFSAFAKEENDDIDFAMALGFIKVDDKSEIDAGAPITRIELAEVFYNIVFPRGDNGVSGEVKFTDVSEEKKHIAAFVYGMGIMRGYSDLVFAPDDEVSHSQAVKAMVSFLGYDLQAGMLGGYPSGYLAQAVRLNLLSGNTAGDDKITYAGLFKMLKKALGADIAIWNNVGPDNTAVSQVLKGVNYLEYYRKIKVLKGVVSGNYLTGTDNPTNYFGVYIGEDKFEVLEKADGLQELLGQEVYVYYTEENGYKEAVYFEEGANNIIEIADSDIVSVSKGNIKYYAGDKALNASFAGNAALIYNGTMEKSYSASDLNPFAGGKYDGFIKLIDAGGDGVFETIVVNAFESVVVGDVRNNKIYGMYNVGNGVDKVIDVTNYKDRNIDIINIKGDISNLSALRRGYVANICRDKSGAIKRILITKDSMSGVIEEVSYSGGKISAVKIGGAEFGVSNGLVLVDSQNKLKAGAEATVFFNFGAEIALIDLEGKYLSSYKKGFLIDAATVGGLQKSALCVIYGEEGKVEEYTFADRVLFCGAPLESENLIANLGYEGNRVKRQVILFKTDADGKVITALETALALSEGDAPFEGFYKYPGNSFTYNIGYKSFADSYLANSDTIIFTYPDEKYRDNYERYGTMTLPTGEGAASYNIELYGTSKVGMIAEIGAIKRSSGGGGGDNSRRPYFIVSSVSNALNEEGEAVIKVSGHYMGGINFYSGAFMIGENVLAAGDLDRNGKKPFLDQNETMFAPGDIYTVPDFSLDGMIESIDTSSFYQVYDFDDNAFMNATGYATTTDRKYYIGKVLYRNGSAIQIELPDGTKKVFEIKSGAFRCVEVTRPRAGAELIVAPSTYESILSEDTHPGEGSTVVIHGRGMGIGCYIYNVKR